MSLRLPFFQSGRPMVEQVTADKLNQMVEAIRQCEVHSGVGYDVSRGPGGATLTIRQQGHQYTQGTGAQKLVGPSNSGMSHTDASVVVNPGVESYGFQCKTPTGSYTTALVSNPTFSFFFAFNTANNFGLSSLVSKRSAKKNNLPVLAANDLFRSINMPSNYQGNVEKANQNNVTPYASLCAGIASGNYLDLSGSRLAANFPPVATHVGAQALTAVLFAAGTSGTNVTNCSGVEFSIVTQAFTNMSRFFYTFDAPESSAGSYTEDITASEVAPTGHYTFKRTFDLGDLSPASVKMRFRVRLLGGPTQSFVNVKINGVNASYVNFEAQTSTVIPIEISDGFVAGSNELEVLINNSSSTFRPAASFEFLPTSATIVTTAGFSILTDAQKDLVGTGTPVEVTVGGTSSLFSYNGSGDKGTTASYTFVRDL